MAKNVLDIYISELDRSTRISSLDLLILFLSETELATNIGEYPTNRELASLVLVQLVPPVQHLSEELYQVLIISQVTVL